MRKPPAKHPSGLTWERWNWPFHTETEKQMIGRYMRKQWATEKREKKKKFNEMLTKIEPALF